MMQKLSKEFNEITFSIQQEFEINRSLPSLLRRVKALDSVLQQYILTVTLEVGKAINLYAILKTDRLFFEFMDQIIKQKFELNDYYLERKELNLFFTTMAEQDATIAGWSEQNVERLKQAYTELLLDSGILKSKKQAN